jgi:hypothetical protein
MRVLTLPPLPGFGTNINMEDILSLTQTTVTLDINAHLPYSKTKKNLNTRCHTAVFKEHKK